MSQFPLYVKMNFLMNVLMPVASRNPPLGKIASLATTIISQIFGIHVYRLPTFCLLSFPHFFISKIKAKNPNLAHKIAWLTPALVIGVITAVAHALFNCIANPYAKTGIFGIHQLVIGILSRGNLHNEDISLDNGLGKLLGVKKELIESKKVEIKKIEITTEVVACTVLVVSTLGLACLGCHPILNSTISCAVSSATKVLLMRVQLALAPLR